MSTLQNTDHLMKAYTAIRNELDKLGVAVEVSRKHDGVHPTMKRNGAGVGLYVESGGWRSGHAEVLVFRSSYGRGGKHRYPVKVDGSVNAKALARVMAPRILWDDGSEDRENAAKARKVAAKAVFDPVKQVLGYNDGRDEWSLPIRPVESDGKPLVELKIGKLVAPDVAVAVIRLMRDAGVDI